VNHIQGYGEDLLRYCCHWSYRNASCLSNSWASF